MINGDFNDGIFDVDFAFSLSARHQKNIYVYTIIVFFIDLHRLQLLNETPTMQTHENQHLFLTISVTLTCLLFSKIWNTCIRFTKYDRNVYACIKSEHSHFLAHLLLSSFDKIMSQYCSTLCYMSSEIFYALQKSSMRDS